jgi:hypothetical protein
MVQRIGSARFIGLLSLLAQHQKRETHIRTCSNTVILHDILGTVAFMMKDAVIAFEAECVEMALEPFTGIHDA